MDATEKSWLERHLALVIAMGGILSAVLSASVTHYWTRSRALEEKHFDLRIEQYSRFLEGQTLLRQGMKEEGDPLMDQAKLKILLMGSGDVVCSMARYWAKYAVDKQKKIKPFPPCPKEGEEELRTDAAIYQAMRREVFGSLGVADPDLDAAVVVPYLRGCVLPGTDWNRLCGRSRRRR
jgi:hypothetical protein